MKELLRQPGIDVNPVDNEGMTPVMEATKYGKFESLKVKRKQNRKSENTEIIKVLLEDSRVDLDVDDEDGTIEELLGAGLSYPIPPPKITFAWNLFQTARADATASIQDEKERNKVAVIVINCDYKQSKFYDDLEGPQNDLQLAKKLFEAKGYVIYIIKNSKMINEDVLDLIEDKHLG